MLITNYSASVDNKTHPFKDSLINKDGKITERGVAINVTYGLIGVLSFTSNVVFCLAMSTRRRGSLTLHDQLILSLAIADTFTGKATSLRVSLSLSNLETNNSKTNISMLPQGTY